MRQAIITVSRAEGSITLTGDSDLKKYKIRKSLVELNREYFNLIDEYTKSNDLENRLKIEQKWKSIRDKINDIRADMIAKIIEEVENYDEIMLVCPADLTDVTLVELGWIDLYNELINQNKVVKI